MWLKRATPQNIVIAARPEPSRDDRLGRGHRRHLAALDLLFLIIFLWTPPHFWALALYKQGDYGAAGIPMLPNVAGEPVTKLQILIYSSPRRLDLPANAIHMSGWIYGAVASSLEHRSSIWHGGSTGVGHGEHEKVARSFSSIRLSYLFVIFLALLVDHYAYAAGWA